MARHRKSQFMVSQNFAFTQVKEIPLDSNRPRYTCTFFNHDSSASVPVTGLTDFVQAYGHWVRKPLKHSQKDRAIVEALEAVADGVLETEKKAAGVLPFAQRPQRFIAQCNQLENKSSEDGPSSITSHQKDASIASPSNSSQKIKNEHHQRGMDINNLATDTTKKRPLQRQRSLATNRNTAMQPPQSLTHHPSFSSDQ